jgi:hypothetical protein
MTAQISDRVKYQGGDYQLAGVKGAGLFDPASLGLQPVATNTANWRGYHCEYAVRDDRLELSELHIGLASPEPIAILGLAPTWETISKDTRQAGYKDMRAPIAFTGGMLIGDGFIQQMYVHMGFHPAYKYRVVHELLFEAGRLASATDQSDNMERVRRSVAGRSLQPGTDAGKEEVMEWIKTTFSLEYW